MALRYALFESPYDLAQALTVCWKGPFPEDLYEVEGRFAVREDGFDVDALAKKQGWQYAPVSLVTKRPRTVPLRTLVSKSWQFRDPLRFRGDGSHRDDGVLFDPTRHSTDFLVGARTHEEAARLLDGLTAHLLEDMAVVPVVVRDAPPFQFFWLVASDFAPLDVLKRAPMAWWYASATDSGASIWVQWPYSIHLPPSFLQRIPWNAGSGGLVLLNRVDDGNASEVLVAKADFIARQSIEHFADLHVARSVRDVAAAGEIAPARFPIELRLVAGAAHDLLAERIAHLKGQIAARQHTLERLQDELNEADPPVPEPLFLYSSDSDAAVPDELQRLLIEWTDLPGDLESVLYQKLDGAGFDDGKGPVHVVTTARALSGGQGASSLGTRLFEYRPRRGTRVAFDQLPGWTPYGLHIFTPRDRGLRLYPRLRESAASADQLAAALFGRRITAEERARWLVLLIDDARGQITARRIPAQGFRPIARAVRWDCAIDVAPASLVTRSEIQEAFEDSFVASLEKQLADAAARVAQERVDRKCAELEQQVATHTRRLADVDARNQAIGAAFATANALSRELAPQVERMRTALLEIRKRLAAPAQLDRLATSLTELRELNQTYAQASARLNELLRQLEELR